MEEDGISFRTYPEPDKEGRVPRELPPKLLQLTYQNRLRTIGRHLDLNEQRSVVILEVVGGFIARCVSRPDRNIELLEFPDASYPERMIGATESRGQGERLESPSTVAPTGYEDLLRAIGRAIDALGASKLVMIEKGDAIVVTGETVSGSSPEPFEMQFDERAITEVLDEAFRLRSSDKEHGSED